MSRGIQGRDAARELLRALREARAAAPGDRYSMAFLRERFHGPPPPMVPRLVTRFRTALWLALGISVDYERGWLFLGRRQVQPTPAAVDAVEELL